jgi:hypothetical protein
MAEGAQACSATRKTCGEPVRCGSSTRREAPLPMAPGACYASSVPQKILVIARVLLVLVALGLIAFLLFRAEIGGQARMIVIAALGYYAVRLWVMGSRARRRRREALSSKMGSSS